MPLTEKAFNIGRDQHTDYMSDRLAKWDAMYGRYSANPRPDTPEVAALRAELSGRDV